MEIKNTVKTIYLVDLENIGQTALYDFVKQNPEEEFVIFYSDKTTSPGIILEHVPENLIISFVLCESGSDNAMDFCICTTAGLIASKDFQKIVIISDDKGYDPAVHMLQQKGMRIKRENTAQADDGQMPCLNGRITKVVFENVPKRYQNEVFEALKNVSGRKAVHEMLQKIMPQTTAAETYNKLKKYIPKTV